MDNDVIQICIAIYDAKGTYSKYAGVTMRSIIENTQKKIVFHILCDDSLSEDNRKKIVDNIKEYDATIVFYNVDVSDLSAEESTYHRITIGTMFRLKIFEALPESMDKVIQLDADIICNIDINELWNMKLEDNVLAACQDQGPARKVICEKGLVSYDEYANVGVVLWNIKRIREIGIDFYKASNDFFREVPDVRLPDEEAVNVIFKGKIMYFPDRFNYMTVWTRQKHEQIEKKIYHFGGDVPRVEDHFMIDRLFRNYLKKTPWWNTAYEAKLNESIYKEKQKRVSICTLLKKECSDTNKKRCFWGVGGSIHPFIMDRFDIRETDVFVDIDEGKHGTYHYGHVVESPSILREFMKEKVVIVNTIYRYKEVKEYLDNMGLTENVHYFNGKYLLDNDLLASFFGERELPYDI